MRNQILSLVALAAGASAQGMMNLTALLASTPELSNLTTYVSLFPSLLTSLGSATNITVLAPSNAAFEAFIPNINIQDTGLIQAVLEYHVLSGVYDASAITTTPAFIPSLLDNSTYENVTGGQVVEAVRKGSNVTFISGLLAESTVTQANINFTGGVVHVIDKVLTLPANVADTAIAANLTSLVGALTAVNITSTLESLTDVTIFAPDNAAFQAIGSALPNLTMAQVTQILAYHVVNGTVGYSSDLTNGMSLPTLGGGNVTITIRDGEVFVNSAKVIVPNVLIADGVVHVIDNVLNPNDTSATPAPSATTGVPAFSGASSATAPPFTSGVATPTATLGGGAGPAPSSASAGAGSGTASGSAAVASSTGGAASQKGAVAAAALFGGVVAVYNM